MAKFPREIWLLILKIKTFTAIKNRLEKILKFPKYDIYDGTCNVSIHYWKFASNTHGNTLIWHVASTASGLKVTITKV